MKKTYTLLSLLGLTLIFFSCGGGGDNGKPSGPITPDKVAVTSVSLSKTTADLEIGSTLQLSATVSPSNATDKSVTWSSSNASAATVTPTGLVTGKAEGTSNITATAGGKSATCKVTVKKPAVAVTSVELDQTDITIKVGETQTLKATVKPDNASDKTVAWGSSKPDIASVDNNGKVTAIKEGVASITASCGGKTASCKVTVEKAIVPVVSITLSQTSLALTEGDSETITATINPIDASDQTVTWSSSNTSVAEVNSGNISAKSPGNTVITASCGDKSATCQVTVNAKVIEVTSITLSQTSLTLTEGDSKTITATINPSNATDKTVTWTSSNTGVAEVSNGNISAKSPGNVDITASCGGKSATCRVTVNEKIEITSIAMTNTEAVMFVGDDLHLGLHIYPVNSTDKNVTWISSNEEVVRVVNPYVFQNGNESIPYIHCVAIAEGSATITAKISGKVATCEISVIKSFPVVIGDRDDEDIDTY
ncbi:MAG: Ig domain-containing protein [Bacteroidales bacterium]|nr:Ig domain-containing protein [Bacteroidales bacterium]